MVKIREMKRKYLYKAFLLLVALNSAIASELVPFTTDGCSSFPDGNWENHELWLECCTAHDFAYWIGGSYQDRLDADNALQECVSDVGEHFVGIFMLAGVRIGGTPFLPTSFRWGYGWPYPRAYADPTDKELEQLRKYIDQQTDSTLKAHYREHLKRKASNNTLK